MKRLAIVFMAALLMAACDIETSDNGKLDGFWQLTQLDTLSTGGTTDMRSSQYFWAVQVNLLEIRNIESPYHSVFFRFSHSDDELYIHSPYFDKRIDHDPQVTDPKDVEPYGLQGLEEHFQVERLDGGHMTLRSAAFRFYFRRY